MTKLKRALALLTLAAACGDPNAPQPDHIEVSDNFFTPGTYKIAPGDTVWWVWSGRAQHDVRFGDGGPSSPVLFIGDFRRTFPNAGSFTYICTLHGGMVGTILVGQQ